MRSVPLLMVTVKHAACHCAYGRVLLSWQQSFAGTADAPQAHMFVHMHVQTRSHPPTRTHTCNTDMHTHMHTAH